jgi:hypothetical protein
VTARNGKWKMENGKDRSNGGRVGRFTIFHFPFSITGMP